MDPIKDEKKDSDYGTLAGFREMLRKQAESAKPMQMPQMPVKPGVQDPTNPKHTLPGMTMQKHFARGGMVDINDIPPAAQPMSMPSVPPLNDVASSLNKTPDTDYSFFNGGLSADDRLALQQKLMAQRTSPGSMVTQGLAGLGDAISNSYGGKNTSFQKDVMANQDNMQKSTLEGVDTARSQKMQDMQANQEMIMNDPNHPMAAAMRAILKSQNIPVPSGMPAGIMLKALGPLGELAMKQATISLQKQVADNTNMAQKEGHKIEATKALSGQGVIGRLLHPDVTKQLEQQAGMGADHGIPDLGSTFNGGKVLKVTRVK